MHNIKVHKDEINIKSKLGVSVNKIVEINNFITQEEASSVIDYLNNMSDSWSFLMGFYGSSGIPPQDYDEKLTDFGLPPDFFTRVKEKMKLELEKIMGIESELSISYIQIWEPGAIAGPHSDNSDFNGVPNNLQSNKFSTLIYLNDDFGGGELYFPEHNIEIKPSPGTFVCYPGGVENIHGVREVIGGRRFSIAAFWDLKKSKKIKIKNYYKQYKKFVTNLENKKDQYGSYENIPLGIKESLWRNFTIRETHLNKINPIILDEKIIYFEGLLGNPDETIEKINYLEENNVSSSMISKWKNWESSDGNYKFGKTKTIDESKYFYSSNRDKGIYDKIKTSLEYAVEEYADYTDVKIGKMSPLTISKYEEGKFMGPHTDEKTGAHISAILYLNDNYESGEIEFPNQGIVIKPKRGSVIVFPSTEPYVHGTKPPVGGSRIVCPAFWYL